MSGDGTDRSTTSDVHVLACAECPRVSTITARGWKAYWTHDEDETSTSADVHLPRLRAA